MSVPLEEVASLESSPPYYTDGPNSQEQVRGAAKNSRVYDPTGGLQKHNLVGRIPEFHGALDPMYAPRCSASIRP